MESSVQRGGRSSPTRPAPRPRWLPRWQNVARLGIVTGLVLFATVLFGAIRERAAPLEVPDIERDPTAIIESTGAELVQTTGGVENYRLNSGHQLTFNDGSMRFDDGFRLEVAEQEGRDSFVITGAKASVNEAETEVLVEGGVEMEVSDGLGADTETATYATDVAEVHMPGPTRLARSGLLATGEEVVFHRDRGLVELGSLAQVTLTGDSNRAPIDIASGQATLDHDDGFMRFNGGTDIDTEEHWLTADNTSAYFGDDDAALERLELVGATSIATKLPQPAGLREMQAGAMALSFLPQTRALDHALLTGTSIVNLMGLDGTTGARVRASTMDVTMKPGGGDVSALVARTAVRLELPDTGDGIRREIRAETLTTPIPQPPPPTTANITAPRTAPETTTLGTPAQSETAAAAANPPAASATRAPAATVSTPTATETPQPGAPAAGALTSPSVALSALPRSESNAITPDEHEAATLTTGETGSAESQTSRADPEPEAGELAGSDMATAPTGNQLTSVSFDRDVRYVEQTPGNRIPREIRADRLEAGVEPGLSALLEARFLGSVHFEDGDRSAEAELVIYDVVANQLSLETDGGARQAPRLVDGEHTIEAGAITVDLGGSTIAATGGVQNVLASREPGQRTADEGERPALLENGQQVFASATTLSYDQTIGQATYDGEARLWQGDTSFQGDTVLIDDTTGGIEVDGDAKTTIQLLRLDEATGRQVLSITRVQADTFTYDNTLMHAVYDQRAELLSEHGDMKAGKIEVYLAPDGRTLDRLEATGSVKLRLEDRWATGDHLVYYEADGRYEMEGAPVEIVEEVEPEASLIPQPPPRPGSPPTPPPCQSTTGRSMTFYRDTDTVIVDGRRELRTESGTGTCRPQVF